LKSKSQIVQVKGIEPTAEVGKPKA